MENLHNYDPMKVFKATIEGKTECEVLNALCSIRKAHSSSKWRLVQDYAEKSPDGNWIGIAEYILR